MQAADSNFPHVIAVDGDVAGTHDPSIIKDGDIWYLFATVTGPNPQGQQLPITGRSAASCCRKFRIG